MTFGEQLTIDDLSDPAAEKIGKFQRPGDAAETQVDAAVLAYPATGTQRLRVLRCISEFPEGMTDEQIQVFLGMNPSTQRPRRVELVEGGWIEDSGKRRQTRSKRSAVVWVLTEQGHSHYAA